MKVSPDLNPLDTSALLTRRLQLPAGLVGLPEYRSLELRYTEDQMPFMWMCIHGPDTLEFVVIEPNGLIPDYELELFDEDVAALGLKDAADAVVLNIVTVKSGAGDATATVNLNGPVIINRRTGAARQCVLANYSKYSAHYPLIANGSAQN